MKKAGLTAEDSFEKARHAFFGTGNTTTKQSASSAQNLKSRNDAAKPEYLQETERLSQAPNSSPILGKGESLR